MNDGNEFYAVRETPIPKESADDERAEITRIAVRLEHETNVACALADRIKNLLYRPA